MIPYQTDPTLHDREPVPAQLDDGFSPPDAGAVEPQTDDLAEAAQVPAVDGAGS